MIADEAEPVVLRIAKHVWDNSMKIRLQGVSSEPKEDEFSCFACGYINFIGEGHCRSCHTYLGGGGGDGQDSASGEFCSPVTPGGRRRKSIDLAPTMEKELTYLKSLLARINEQGQLSLVKCPPREEEISAIGSMPYTSVCKHLISLRLEQVQRMVRPIITKLMLHQKNADGMFNRPVDPVALDLHDYFTRVKHPMDLGTVRSKLHRGLYESHHAAAADVNIIFRNAMTYNPPSHHVHQLAKAIKVDFDQDITQLDDRFQKDIERKAGHSPNCKLCQGETCQLCGEKCLKFEPPVLVCHGTCMQRVKRNATYYVTTDGIMLWCQKCHTSLPQLILEVPNGPPVLKRNLMRCKSDEEVAEAWVSCDACGKWVHEICGLYNERFGDADHSGKLQPRYECPRCKLEAKSVEGRTSVVVVRQVGRPRGRPKLTSSAAKSVSPASAHDGDEAPVADGDAAPMHNGVSEDTNTGSDNGLMDTDAVDTPRQIADSGPGGVGSVGVNGNRDSKGRGSSESGDSSDDKDKVQGDNGGASSLSVSASCWQREMTTDHQEGGDAISDEDVEVDGEGEVEGDGGDASMELADGPRLVPPETQGPTLLSGHKTKRAESPISPQSSSGGMNSNGCSSGGSLDSEKQWRASSLPRTRMSDFMEAMVASQLHAYGFADIVSSVTVRMVSNTDQHVEVPEPIVENMMTAEGKRVPEHLGYRQKCVLLFQNIDGIDVCLFCLYVQEFGESCPAPNKSVVYISYLDSVDYFRPIEARTLVYHEIMVSYLKWVQSRGFRQLHIWSCPPQRGDNFIFWCHPMHQRTPSRDRLNMWYNEMLLRATKIGVVRDIENLFGAYFQQYVKKERDETNVRSCAARSYVAMGNAKADAKGGNKGKGKGKSFSRQPSATALSAGATSSTTASTAVETEGGDGTGNGVATREELAPICPPVFEGDFWVNECLRVHRTVVTRARGDDGQERDINKRRAREMIKSLLLQQGASVFSKPVDPDGLGLSDYFTVITKPMDLGTVREKLRKDSYSHMLDLAEDVRLTFRNATAYNPPGHWVNAVAQNLLADYEKMLLDMVTSNCGSSGLEDGCVENVNRLLASYPLLGSLIDGGAAGGAGGKAGGDQLSPRGSKPVPLQRGRSFDSNISAIGEPGIDDNENKDGAASDEHDHVYDEDAESPRPTGGRRFSFPDGPSIRRLDSMDSTAGADVGGGDDFAVASRRPLRSGAVMGVVAEQNSEQILPFEKPEMGYKGAMTMMNELAKNVDRLKVDLFIVHFAPPGSLPSEISGGSGSTAPNASKRARLATTSIATTTTSAPTGSVAATVGESVEDEVKEEEAGTAAASGGSGPVAARKAIGGPGVKEQPSIGAAPRRHKGYRGKAGAYLRRIANGSISQETEDCTIPAACLMLLQGISPDTTDPDQAFSSPFVDTRHTFLEMCQFRHYQFDQLRRAKHSSLMLLYHLHHPLASHLRPKCKLCGDSIRDVRWHCGDGCANYDVCDKCYQAVSCRHPHMPGHKLMPFRITFA